LSRSPVRPLSRPGNWTSSGLWAPKLARSASNTACSTPSSSPPRASPTHCRPTSRSAGNRLRDVVLVGNA